MRKLILHIFLLSLLSPLLAQEEKLSPKRVDEATRQFYLEFYKYDRNLPLNAESKILEDNVFYALYKVSFDSVHNQRISALLVIPKLAQKPLPCILFLHGYGGNKEDLKNLIPILTLNGYAGFALDAEYHGERKKEGRDMYAPYPYTMRDAMIQTIIDYRRGIDYLSTLPEVDKNRIGFVGGSMGGILGGVLVGVEERIKASVLVVGGGDYSYMLKHSQHSAIKALRALNLDMETIAKVLAPVDPINFIDLASPRPILFLCGKKDDIVPAQAGQFLYNVAKEPKKIIWYDAGHGLPIDEVVKEVTLWFKQNL